MQRAGGFIKDNAWNLTRHLLMGAAWAGTALLLSKYVPTAGAAVAVAGLNSLRKGLDLKRTSQGKPDILTAAKNRITRTRGDGMGIRNEVYEVKDELVKIGIILTDDIPNGQQLTEGMGAVLGVIKEGSDFKDIPQQERAKAIAHAFTMAGAEIYDKAVRYSDEVTT